MTLPDKLRQRSADTRRRQALVAVVSILLVASACGSTDDGVASAAETTSQDQPTTTVQQATTSTSVADEPTTSIAGEDELQGLPASADPCAEAAAHAVGETVEYSIEVNGSARPVGVRVGGDAALSDPIVLVGFHGATLPWESTIGIWAEMTPVLDILGSPERQIFFSAQATTAEPPFWTESKTFNIEYADELFSRIRSSVCLEEAEVFMLGSGQGTLAALQAYCFTELPVDAILLESGLVPIADCAPSNPTPIISFDPFDFHENVLAHFDGGFTPPPPVEQEIVGGVVNSVPEDLATWAAIHQCTDEPTETTVPDPDDLLERDTVQLSYSDCDAPLVAFGVENGATPTWGDGVSTEAMLAATDAIREALESALGQ